MFFLLYLQNASLSKQLKSPHSRHGTKQCVLLSRALQTQKKKHEYDSSFPFIDVQLPDDDCRNMARGRGTVPPDPTSCISDFVFPECARVFFSKLSQRLAITHAIRRNICLLITSLSHYLVIHRLIFNAHIIISRKLKRDVTNTSGSRAIICAHRHSPFKRPAQNLSDVMNPRKSIGTADKH